MRAERARALRPRPRPMTPIPRALRTRAPEVRRLGGAREPCTDHRTRESGDHDDGGLGPCLRERGEEERDPTHVAIHPVIQPIEASSKVLRRVLPTSGRARSCVGTLRRTFDRFS